MRYLYLGLACLWMTPALAAELVADGEKPDTKVVVQQLKRGDNSLTLRFTLVNDSDQAITGIALSGRETWTTDGVYLVDTIGKKKYETIHDSEGHCICSAKLNNFAPRSSVNLWAKFPAPPENVVKIGVNIPHFIPLDNVPIE